MTAPTEPTQLTSARPSARAVLAWAATTAVLGTLDGAAGLVVGVGLAAWLLAGFRMRGLLLVSAALWAAIPVIHLVDGLPSRGGVAPAFVLRNPLTYHLAFAGAVLLVATSILDRPVARPSGADEAGTGDPQQSEPMGRVPVRLRQALVVVAGAALAIAVLAVSRV